VRQPPQQARVEQRGGSGAQGFLLLQDRSESEERGSCERCRNGADQHDFGPQTARRVEKRLIGDPFRPVRRSFAIRSHPAG